MPISFPKTEPAWGLRAYLALIGCAAGRQTVTYEALARILKRGSPRRLAKPLALIARWCQDHSLPALTCLAVEQDSGLTAPDLSAVSADAGPREQERVWQFDWYAIVPPTIAELTEPAPPPRQYVEYDDETTAIRILVTLAAVAAVIAGVFLYAYIVHDVMNRWS